MTTRTSAVATGCVGEGCDTLRSWPLHHVRHRGVFRLLCTSCVLKCFSGDFCTSCFNLVDDPYPSRSASWFGSRPAVVHCSFCPSVSHLACLTNPGVPIQFTCPNCRNPEGFSYFPVCGRGGDELQRPPIDIDSAKALLAAARLAATSMCNAAAAARAEAERKVMEAVGARKRARDLLERATSISKKERKRKKEHDGSNLKALPSTHKNKKKKTTKPNGSAGSCAVIVQKRANTREKQKCVRSHEQMPEAHFLTPITAKDAKLKGTSVDKMQSNASLANKVSSSTKLNLPKNAEHQGKKKKELLFSPQTQSSTPHLSKDASISRSDQKAKVSKLPK